MKYQIQWQETDNGFRASIPPAGVHVLSGGPHGQGTTDLVATTIQLSRINCDEPDCTDQEIALIGRGRKGEPVELRFEPETVESLVGVLNNALDKLQRPRTRRSSGLGIVAFSRDY